MSGFEILAKHQIVIGEDGQVAGIVRWATLKGERLFTDIRISRGDGGIYTVDIGGNEPGGRQYTSGLGVPMVLPRRMINVYKELLALDEPSDEEIGVFFPTDLEISRL